MTAPYDVAIVGYGPVGVTLAALLGQRGLRVVAFDATTSVYHLPRAAHFDSEIMRVFAGLGVADEVAAVTGPVLGMDFVTADRERLFGFAADGRPSGYFFYQPDLERILREAVARCPSVDVHLGTEVIAVRAISDRAVEVDAGGVTYQAAWVVGCDGARSTTRRSCAVELDDYGFDQPWLVVDGILRRPVDLPPLCQQICDPARPSTFVPMLGDRRRWEFMLMPGETAADLERPDTMWRLLAPWVGPDDFEVIRAVVYTFHALVATRWRSGRVLLAGDAAHQMPPFLGQGMCSGIRDAANLAWKVAAVVRGEAPERLLDTYQEEREPHVRTIINRAVAAGGIIQTTDPALAALRDAQLRQRGENDPLGGDARMPGLAGGVVGAGGGELAPAELDPLLGPGFTVAGPPLDDLAAARWRRLGATVAVTDGPEHLVVRPDRYLFGTAADPAALAALAADLEGHLTVQRSLA